MPNILNLKFSIFITILLGYFSYEVVLANDTVNNDLQLNRKWFKSMKEFEIGQAVDEDLCEKQINLTENTITFLDWSAKMPSGILLGNLNNFGQYEQCISLNEIVEGVNIRGKYCMMEMHLEIEENANLPVGITDGILRSGLFGICVPNACHPADINETVLPGVIIIGEEIYCREINDKPLSVQDVVAIVVFSVLGFLVIASSAYELCSKIFFNKDTPKMLKSFSVYHNVNKLTRIANTANPLHCINGIRVLSMAWVVVGHTYFTHEAISIENPVDVLKWKTSFRATWISAAPLSVDTFFYLAGFLLTWSVIKKFNNSVIFLKSIPLLYLNRYLRLTPLLVAVMLLQVSYFNHVSDGPDWRVVSETMNNCLEGWWPNLLYVQNYVRPSNSCLPHSWYLAVDMQLYLLSPLVICFLLSGIKRALSILTVVLSATLGVALAYTYYFNFSNMLETSDNNPNYMHHYYYNTLTRSPPFILGITVAYIMSILKAREVKISNELYKFVHWITIVVLLFLPFYGTYLTSNNKVSQDNINFFNAWHRASWALGVGGIIFACMHGFGGPIQWVLSLEMWTVPARLSYAVYLMHFPILLSVVGSATTPIRFADPQVLYNSVADLGLSFFAAFVVHLVVEAPSAELSNLLFAKIAGKRKEDDKKMITKNEFQSPSSVDIIKDIGDFKNCRESKEQHLTTAPNLSNGNN